MSTNLHPIRSFIHNCIKTFPWSYPTQADALCAYIDTLIVGRQKSRRACLKAGMTNITDRQLQYSLQQTSSLLPLFNAYFQQRFATWDRRRNYYLSFDDTSNRRYGKKVYGTAHQYDHSRSGTYWSNVIVDGVIASDRILAIAHQEYLPKKFLQRQNNAPPPVYTKIQIMREKTAHWRKKLLAYGIPPKQIWHTIDCWYTHGEFTREVRQTGTNLMMGLKKDTPSYLFGEKYRIDHLFAKEHTWHYRTNPVSGKKVWFKSKLLNLSTHGRCRVLAIRRGAEKKIRYYGTTKLKISIESALKHLRIHWRVETLHKDAKHLFGLNHCYSGKQRINQTHWGLCYLLVYLFQVFQVFRGKQEKKPTIHRLWDHYCFHYDAERAKKCFLTPKKRRKSIKLLNGG